MQTIQKTTAYSTVFEQLTDMQSFVGQELGLSDWMSIEQSRINAFANVTEDLQWIHTNPERAKRHSPYKTTIAHGFLILSLAPKIMQATLKVKNVGMAINYGLDRVRFVNATPAGAMIRARVTLMSFEEQELGGKYKLLVTYEIKGQEKPACVAEFIVMAYTESNHNTTQTTKEPVSQQDTSEPIVKYREEGKVAILTLNRPKRYNAVTTELVIELRAHLQKIRNNDQTRAVVLTGAGKGFCAGADINTFGSLTPEDGRAYLTSVYQPLIRDLFTLKKPVIGAVNGTAAGVGASIALACDLRVMSPQSSILYAFINIGLGPDGGGSWLLARQIGYSRALEIAIEGKKVQAQRCLELGLTNKLVESEEMLLPTALTWAKMLADRPTLAVGITKQDLLFAMSHDIYDTIAYEAEKQAEAFASHDLKEGVMAFMEKRPAVFIGQ